LPIFSKRQLAAALKILLSEEGGVMYIYQRAVDSTLMEWTKRKKEASVASFLYLQV